MSNQNPQENSQAPITYLLASIFKRKKKKIKPFSLKSEQGQACTALTETTMKVWERELPGLLWKPRVQGRQANRGIKVRPLCNPDFCFNDDHEHTTQESCSVHPLNMRAYKRGCLCPHSHLPHSLLSHTYIRIHLASWSATKEGKRPGNLLD